MTYVFIVIKPRQRYRTGNIVCCVSNLFYAVPSQHLFANVLAYGTKYEGRSIYKEPVAAVFLIFEILKIQDTRFVENSISNIFR